MLGLLSTHRGLEMVPFVDQGKTGKISPPRSAKLGLKQLGLSDKVTVRLHSC